MNKKKKMFSPKIIVIVFHSDSVNDVRFVPLLPLSVAMVPTLPDYYCLPMKIKRFNMTELL